MIRQSHIIYQRGLSGQGPMTACISPFFYSTKKKKKKNKNKTKQKKQNKKIQQQKKKKKNSKHATCNSC